MTERDCMSRGEWTENNPHFASAIWLQVACLPGMFVSMRSKKFQRNQSALHRHQLNVINSATNLALWIHRGYSWEVQKVIVPYHWLQGMLRWLPLFNVILAGKLPKNPIEVGDLDPERWLPRRERSYFRGKRKDKRKDIGELNCQSVFNFKTLMCYTRNQI